MQSYMLKVLRVGEPIPETRIDAPRTAHGYWNRVIKKQTWFDESKEHLVVLLLSTRYGVEGYALASVGTLNESIAHPREIFRAAIAGGSYAIIVMHNHPSGDASPSQTDRWLTRRLTDAAELLQVRLFDHVIVGRRNLRPVPVKARSTRKQREAQAVSRRGYFSFKEEGCL
ncbi:MAG: JAB domain-containing protein [Chthoniobacterales bacterium]